MTVTIQYQDDYSILHCDACPEWAPLRDNYEFLCEHIGTVIATNQDDDVKPEATVRLPVVTHGPRLAQDGWFGFVTVTLGPALRGGSALATGHYQPEMSDPVSFDIGLVVPGEGRFQLAQSINEQIMASPDIDKGCLSVATHNFVHEKECAEYRGKDQIANLFSQVLERCCIPCYRSTNSNGWGANVPDPWEAPEWSRTRRRPPSGGGSAAAAEQITRPNARGGRDVNLNINYSDHNAGLNIMPRVEVADEAARFDYRRSRRRA